MIRSACCNAEIVQIDDEFYTCEECNKSTYGVYKPHPKAVHLIINAGLSEKEEKQAFIDLEKKAKLKGKTK